MIFQTSWSGEDTTNIGEELENSTIRANYELNQYGVPRNGKRREYNLGFNFRYEPFRWLTLTAGGRYTNFQLQDKSRRLESGTNKTGDPLEMNRGIKYSIGQGCHAARMTRITRQLTIFGEMAVLIMEFYMKQRNTQNKEKNVNKLA